MRIGQGWDRHKLILGRKLILGNIQIESDFGSEAHSDGDVLIHAIIDSLFGACALGDIGAHFPPIDEKYKNIDSAILLSKTIQLISEHGYKIENIDSTIVLEKPKLQPYILSMRTRLAEICNINIEQISIKAKTAEGCDSAGEGKAIEAMAVTLLTKTN